MATAIAALAISGSRKADGTVNAGGRAFLTVPGTANTAVVAYQDRDKSAAVSLNGGGYLLDAAGKAELFIDTPADVRIEDATGVAVSTFTVEPSTNAGLVEVMQPGWTGVHPVTGQYVSDGTGRTKLDTALASLYASTGGADGKFRGTYGTVDTNVGAEIERFGLTPQRFGAVGNGVADDTAALLLMAAAQLSSGLPIFLPKGVYPISAVVTFGDNVVMRGTGGLAGGSTIKATNAAQNGLIFGLLANLQSFAVISSAGVGTGTGVKVSGQSILTGVSVGDPSFDGSFATGIECTSGTAHLYGGNIAGSVNATVGGWVVDTFGYTFSGAASATTRFLAQTVSAGLFLFSTATADMANGGNATPTVGGRGQPIAYQRIRGTTAGAGTVNATAVPTETKILILDCFNNSGGAFTFTLNAQYHSVGNPAPANGTRRVVAFVWEPTGAFWVEVGRPSADVT